MTSPDCTDPDWRKYTTIPCSCTACAAALRLDETGHFQGCRTHGCAATRCADERWIRAEVAAGRLR